jgi:hypothetical protein
MTEKVSSFIDFIQLVDYSLMNNLKADPNATKDGADHFPREIFSGHYVPVKPTPIKDPQYNRP